MSSVITTSETTTSLFSTPTTTPLTSNSSSSTLQKSKQKSLGKRLWVVGRGNNRQKTRLFLLDENGCQRKYSSEDAAMQRLWRPNSIAVGDNSRHSVKYERGKRRRNILVRIGTLACLAAFGSCFLLWLIFWRYESPKLTQSQTNNINSSLSPFSLSTTNIFDSNSIQTTTLKTSNNYFISSSSPNLTTLNNKIYSTTLQTPRLQNLKFSKILQKNNLDNSPKIIQIHYNINKTIIKNKINSSENNLIEFDRLENLQQQNIPNETSKAILENGNKLGTIKTTLNYLTTKQLETTTPFITKTINSIQTNKITNNLKTTKSFNTSLLSNLYSTKEIENKSKEIIEEEKTQEDEDEDLLWLRNQKIPKRYEETMPKDNYNLKRPTIEFAPVKAESENNESIDENENNNKLNNKQQNNLLNILLSTTAKPTTKIIKYTTINNNEDSSLQEELNEIINSVERSGEINNLKRPFENNKNNINNKNQHFSSLYEEEEIRPVEIPFEPLPLPISEIPIWKRPPPGEDFNNFNLPPPPPPPLPIKFSLQANVKSTSHILPEINNKENDLLRRKRREAPILVTALIDIGRGNWQRFTRHFDQYLNYLTNILFRMQNNIIIYCDSSVYEYLKIIQITLSELPFYKYRKEIEDIMRWEQKNWRKEWDKQMKTHPETLYPDYDILVNSKPYFLYNATQISLFQKGEKEQLFVWVDAGYGHGSQSAIPLGIWSPNKINNEQITIIKLPTHGERVERYTIERVYRKHRSVISGGFLAGGEKIIRRFWTFFMKTFLELLDQRIVDDDQTTLLITIQRYNSTFNLLKGNWFDAFKLLPSKN